MTMQDDENFLNELANDMYGKKFGELDVEAQQKVRAASQLKAIH